MSRGFPSVPCQGMRPLTMDRRFEMRLSRRLLRVLDDVRGRVSRAEYLRLLLESEAERVRAYRAGRPWRAPDHMFVAPV
jgi:hypothetical protein